MIEPSEVRGVVLAGGDSTRFDGGDKALAELDGRPLLAHAVKAVDAATATAPVVGVRSPAQRDRVRAALPEPSRVRVTKDVEELAGPLAGLYAAAEVAATPWLFVCGCDMPLVTADSIAGLCAVDGVERASAVVPRVDGRDQPLHALFGRQRLLDVRPRLGDGDGLSTLLDALERVARPTPSDVDVSLTDAVTNVNTRAELRRVRAGTERLSVD
jgi:molybdopterin-guanine dinucleotide biosynthesis protein A